MRFGIALSSGLARVRELVAGQGTDARDITTHDTNSRGVFQLAGGFLEAQVELLFLQTHQLFLELINRHRIEVGDSGFGLHITLTRQCAERSVS